MCDTGKSALRANDSELLFWRGRGSLEGTQAPPHQGCGSPDFLEDSTSERRQGRRGLGARGDRLGESHLALPRAPKLSGPIITHSLAAQQVNSGQLWVRSELPSPVDTGRAEALPQQTEGPPGTHGSGGDGWRVRQQGFGTVHLTGNPGGREVSLASELPHTVSVQNVHRCCFHSPWDEVSDPQAVGCRGCGVGPWAVGGHGLHSRCLQSLQ